MPVVTGAFHCRLVIHKAMSVHILWWNYTSKSTAEYANPIFAIGCISPSSTCHGDLAVKPRSPPEDQNFALQSGQIPVVRAPQAPTGVSSLARETPTHAHGSGAPRPGPSHVGGTPLPSPAPGCSRTITGISQTNLRPGPVSSPFAGSLTARRSVAPATDPALSDQLRRCGMVPRWWWPCPARVGVAPQFPTLVDQPQSPNRSNAELTGLSVQIVCLATVSQGILPLPG